MSFTCMQNTGEIFENVSLLHIRTFLISEYVYLYLSSNIGLFECFVHPIF